MNANQARDVHHVIERYRKPLNARVRLQQVKGAGYTAYIIYGMGAILHTVHISEGKHVDLSRLPLRTKWKRVMNAKKEG